MIVLGISGHDREACAALVVNGRIVAAAAEERFTRVPGIGYAQTDGFPALAVDACLHAAGLQRGDVEVLTVVADGEAGGAGTKDLDGHRFPRVEYLDAGQADARHAAASATGPGAVVVCSIDPPSMTSFVREGDELRAHRRVSGELLFAAARDLAQALGLSERDPYRALDRLSIGAEPEFQRELEPCAAWTDIGDLVVDRDELAARVGMIEGRMSARLSDAASLNVRVQSARRAIAASFMCVVAQLIHEAAGRLTAGGARTDTIAFGGAMLANSRLVSELGRLTGGLACAAVPELPGRVLGLVSPQALTSLALGPAFSDVEIKRTLDNCRLEYVYEPDWTRLRARTSSMLSQGKVIAWFQGPMGFGPRAMGTRSILCDPSTKYARQNVNEYLKLVPLEEPLPIAFAPSVAGQCLTGGALPPLAAMDVAVSPGWRDRLVSALDWRHGARVHAIGAEHAPELCDLLEHHHRSTGVPALIETNLAGPGEPVACTPRDAVRTVYSSAIDALVIGRFLLMKDYGLLRSGVG